MFAGRNETSFREDRAENCTHKSNYDAVTTTYNALSKKVNPQSKIGSRFLRLKAMILALNRLQKK